jgi:hypothetical protein
MRAEQIRETVALRKRQAGHANHEAENLALTRLARMMAEEPGNVPAALTVVALELCGAGSAGISVIERQGTAEVFRLLSVAGAWATFEGGTMPRDESPCGICLERGAPQLYRNPASFFGCCKDLCPEVRQCLVVPIIVQHQPLGTLWVASHDSVRHFDCEDVRVLSSLAHLTGAALKMLSPTSTVQLSAETHNRMHVQRLRSSCRAALDNYVHHARATCELAACYPLSMEELDDLKERREEEHNAYWKYMDIRQDLLNILVLDSEGTPERFRG